MHCRDSVVCSVLHSLIPQSDAEICLSLSQQELKQIKATDHQVQYTVVDLMLGLDS